MAAIGNVACTKLFCDAGADINLCDKDGAQLWHLPYPLLLALSLRTRSTSNVPNAAAAPEPETCVRLDAACMVSLTTFRRSSGVPTISC